MANILIITHAHDRFRACDYIMRRFVRHWLAAGHRVSVVKGVGDWPDADIAFLHVDLSVVPDAYAEAAQRYPVVVNGAATDIRKRMVSRHLLRSGDAWNGPVIVKTDLNCGGWPELRIHERAIAARSTEGRLSSDLSILSTEAYPVLDSLRDVPDAVWNDRHLVVERFLPDARYFLPTLPEFRAHMSPWFAELEFASAGGHELAQRCPTFVFEARPDSAAD